jgi:hypothetical protein
MSGNSKLAEDKIEERSTTKIIRKIEREKRKEFPN